MPPTTPTNGDDSLVGTEGDDTVFALGGADTVEGGNGADSLEGGDGGDYLIGQAGRDTVAGGAGDDTIEGSGADDAGDLLDGGAGTDEFYYYHTGDGSAGVTIDLGKGTTSSGARLENIEVAYGDYGDDSIVGSAESNKLQGYYGNDTLEGAAGDDTLKGDAGDDTLDGGAGVDTAVFAGIRDEYAVTAGVDERGHFLLVTDTYATDGDDGTDKVYGAEFLQFADQTETACFLPGTLVATPEGETPVETLRRGDLVLTADGRAAPVVWMGRQTVSRRFADPARVLPVRVAAGALGEGLPRRDLLVSPDHALFLDGILVHAGALVNGATIRRETDVPEGWVFWHVELADHALVLAEGVPAETFLDTAGRLAFDNWAEREAACPEGRDAEAMPAPRAKSRRQVPPSLRRRLAALAARLPAPAAA